MTFMDKVIELSDKYRIEHSKMYDLMTYVEIRVISDRPKDYLVHRKDVYEKTYNITERYLRIKNSYSK